MTTIIIPQIEKDQEEQTLGGLTTEGAQSLKAAYAPYFERLHTLAPELVAITEDMPKEAKAARLKIKAIRVEAEKTRKELKEDSLRRGKAIDGINHLLLYQLTPVEKALEEIEKAEERREAARIAALHEDRIAAIAPYVESVESWGPLGSLPIEQWENMLAGARLAHEKRVEELRKAEEARLEAERIAAEEEAKRRAEEAAERERLRLENERLAAEAAKARAEQEAERQRIAAENAKREAAEKAERERIAAEQAKRDAEARAELERLEAIAAEERAKREAAEAKARAEQEEREAKAAAAAKEAADAAKAPDKDKALALADKVLNLRMLPTDMQTTEGKQLAEKITEQLTKMAAWIQATAKKL
jgi:hypothetical protein